MLVYIYGSMHMCGSMHIYIVAVNASSSICMYSDSSVRCVRVVVVEDLSTCDRCET